MADRRHKNVNWLLGDEKGHMCVVEHCILAVLMDLRDELQALNRLLGCQNVKDIPILLRHIKANTTKKRVAKKK